MGSDDLNIAFGNFSSLAGVDDNAACFKSRRLCSLAKALVLCRTPAEIVIPVAVSARRWVHSAPSNMARRTVG
jgi:hypothetical protein